MELLRQVSQQPVSQTVIQVQEKPTLDQLLVRKIDLTIFNNTANPAILNIGGDNVVDDGSEFVNSAGSGLGANASSGNFDTVSIGYSVKRNVLTQLKKFLATNPVIVVGVRANYDYTNFPAQKNQALQVLDNRNDIGLPQGNYGNGGTYVTPIGDNKMTQNQNVSDYLLPTPQIIDGHRVLQYGLVPAVGGPPPTTNNTVALEIAFVSIYDITRMSTVDEFLKNVSLLDKLRSQCFKS